MSTLCCLLPQAPPPTTLSLSAVLSSIANQDRIGGQDREEQEEEFFFSKIERKKFSAVRRLRLPPLTILSLQCYPHQGKRKVKGQEKEREIEKGERKEIRQNTNNSILCCLLPSISLCAVLSSIPHQDKRQVQEKIREKEGCKSKERNALLIGWLNSTIGWLDSISQYQTEVVQSTGRFQWGDGCCLGCSRQEPSCQFLRSSSGQE